MRSSTLVVRMLAAVTASALLVVLAPASSASTDPAATFCKINISSGAVDCQASYDALRARQVEGEMWLAAVFNWINWNEGGGVAVLVSDTKCTSAYDNELNHRIARLDQKVYDNGISLYDTISSFYLYNNVSNCRMRLYDRIKFGSPYSSLLYADCADLRTCSPDNWSDRARSIAFT